MPREEGGCGTDWEIGADGYRYTLLIVWIKEITHENLLHSAQNSMLCGDLNGKEI